MTRRPPAPGDRVMPPAPPLETPLGTLDGKPVVLREGYIWCGDECVDEGTEYHNADAALMMLLYWFDDLGVYTPPAEQRDLAIAAEDAIRARAREMYHDEGTLEIDDNAIVSQSEGGCYVAAWVWVPDEGEEVPE